MNAGLEMHPVQGLIDEYAARWHALSLACDPSCDEQYLAGDFEFVESAIKSGSDELSKAREVFEGYYQVISRIYTEEPDSMTSAILNLASIAVERYDEDLLKRLSTLHDAALPLSCDLRSLISIVLERFHSSERSGEAMIEIEERLVPLCLPHADIQSILLKRWDHEFEGWNDDAPLEDTEEARWKYARTVHLKSIAIRQATKMIACQINGGIDDETKRTITELFERFYECVQTLPDNSSQAWIQSIMEIFDYIGEEGRDPRRTYLSVAVLKDILGQQSLVSQRWGIGYAFILRHSFGRTETPELYEGLKRFNETRDPRLEAFDRTYFGTSGGYGYGDFFIDALTSPVNPRNLTILQLKARTLNCTQAGILERNRLDGIALNPVVEPLREFIHEHHRHLHETLVAMVHFYQTGQRAPLEGILPKIDEPFRTDLPPLALNRDVYDLPVPNSEYNETVIDIVRRLEINTDPENMTPPVTLDLALNDKLKTLADAEPSMERKELGKTLAYLNSSLEEMMAEGTIGIDPQTIVAMQWLQRKSAEILSKVSYEDQIRLFRHNWFWQIVQFTELTFSPHTTFNPEVGHTLKKQVHNPHLENDLMLEQKSRDERDGYRIIGNRFTKNARLLVSLLGTQHPELADGAVWSANIVREVALLCGEWRVPTKEARNISVLGSKHYRQRMAARTGD